MKVKSEGERYDRSDGREFRRRLVIVIIVVVIIVVVIFKSESKG